MHKEVANLCEHKSHRPSVSVPETRHYMNENVYVLALSLAELLCNQVWILQLDEDWYTVS